jgi:molybdenum cofactor cytidylyltransferase
MRIAGVLLAAGDSTRLGEPKQLLDAGGTPLIRVLADEVVAADCADCAVVLGARATEMIAPLARLRATLVVNWEWEEGMGASVRVAADFARSHVADGLLIAVCDQPLLDRAHLGALIDDFRASGGTHPVASAYGGTVGVPAVFPERLFATLAALTGDQGARRVLRDEPDTRSIPWPDGAVDLDTPEDVTAWRAALSSSPRTPRP